MFGLGVQELLVILLIILIFFGAEKIPQLMKSLGHGMAEFRKASQQVKDELKQEVEAVPQVAANAENPAVALKYLTCPACSKQTLEGSAFCSQCGHKILSAERCNNCGRLLNLDEKYCPNCGTKRES